LTISLKKRKLPIMLKLISKILLVALALLVTAEIIPGVEIRGLYIALIAAVILGVLNLVVRPILVLLTLPINILTLGLFTLVINAALFGFAASFIEGFAVDGFISALVGSLIVSIVSTVGNRLV